MATEQGTVLRIQGDRAVVKTKKSEACQGCASRNSCEAQSNNMEVSAINIAGAREGDNVVISIETRPLLKATFLLYLFPIGCLMGGALLGEQMAGRFGMNASALSTVLAFLFLFISLFVIKSKGREMGEKDEYHPRIIRVLRRTPPGEDISEETDV